MSDVFMSDVFVSALPASPQLMVVVPGMIEAEIKPAIHRHSWHAAVTNGVAHRS